jgi:tetrahydromethanopterin S-methyltransferase subunit G
MQTINQYHQQQAKQNKRDAIIIGTLFGLILGLSALLIIAAQTK